MLTHQAFRFELDPTAAQRVLLAKGCGVRRKVWNHFLAQRIALYADGKQRTTWAKQDAEVTQLKKSEWAWMRETSKCIHQSALKDLEQAFQHFFRGLKTGKKVGFPRFKRKFEHDSFREFGRSIKALPRHVRLPKLGKVRLKDSQDQTTRFAGRILSATVSRVADRWFVSIAVERERPNPTPVAGPVVGVDLGLTTFATLSDSEKIEAPKPLRAKLELLARRQRRHAKKQNGSKNRRKSAMKLARLHWRIKNVRQDFLNKLTTRLAKTKSVVVVEDLNVDGMKRLRSLARGVSDLGFSEFRRQLAYKTVWYGSRLVVADRFFPSSKLCSTCGWKNEALTLSDRQWTCGGCGAVHDRDENAAKNLVRLATDPTAGSAVSHACGEVTSGLRSKGRGRKPSVKQEEQAVS